MWMIVKCGDPDCRKEFKVSSKDPEWECPSCSRVIVNRHYPFLTARFMQARIDGDDADWKGLLSDLIESARKEIGLRAEGVDPPPDTAFLDKIESLLSEKSGESNWRQIYDKLLQQARETVLLLERKD